MRRGICVCAALCLVWSLAIGDARATGIPNANQKDAYVAETIDVAEAELGYTEGDGGYTKYAEWSGANKYSEWCSNFVSWCADQADQRLGTAYLGQLYPLQTACITGVEWFTERGRYISATGTLKDYGKQWYRGDGVALADRPYVPRPGELVYFEWYEYNRIDHVGLIERVTQNEDGSVTLHTIEGNGIETEFVKRFSYALDDPSIRAFGVLHDEIGTDMGPGTEGPQVAELQRRLMAGGWADFEVVEYYGEQTTAGVMALQTALGMEPTGVADRLVQEALGMGYEG